MFYSDAVFNCCFEHNSNVFLYQCHERQFCYFRAEFNLLRSINKIYSVCQVRSSVSTLLEDEWLCNLFLYTLYRAEESFSCSIYITVGYVVKGICCSWIHLLINKRCEQETCRYFEFVTLIGLKGGVGDA